MFFFIMKVAFRPKHIHIAVATTATNEHEATSVVQKGAIRGNVQGTGRKRSDRDLSPTSFAIAGDNQILQHGIAVLVGSICTSFRD